MENGFYRYKHIYIYRRQKFQNILERKLCNCFGQLLRKEFSKKNVGNGIENDVENKYGV